MRTIAYRDFMSGSYKQQTVWNEMKERCIAVWDVSKDDWFLAAIWFILIPFVTLVGIDVLLNFMIGLAHIGMGLQ